MSDTRYNLGPNVTYRLLTTDEDIDIVWSITGFDKTQNIHASDSRGVDGWTFDWWQTSTQKFEDYFITGTTTEHHESNLQSYGRLMRDGGPIDSPMYATLILIEINESPAAVIGLQWHYVNSVNGTNDGEFYRLPFNGKSDCWNKWAGLIVIRGIHPDFRGYNLQEMTIRLANEFSTGVNGHDFCNIGLDRSENILVWMTGNAGDEPIQLTDTNADYYNQFAEIEASMLSRPEDYDVIKLPEYFGDANCFVLKNVNSNVKWVQIPTHERYLPWWMVATDSWGENCRQIVDFQFSGHQLASYNWSKYQEIPDLAGDLTREVVDWSKLSYDESDNKLYINIPGYDMLSYIQNNAGSPSVARNMDNVLAKWKNI